MLTELAEIGMTIARAAGQWALEPGEGEAEHVRPHGFRGDPGLVYSRVARAVRLTLMLQTRLLKDLPALGRAETLARMGAEQSRRERAHRLTVRAIRAEHDEADAVEHLSDEAWERLRDEDLSDDVGTRPFGEVVARICRDLGLSPDWGAWASPLPSSSGEAQPDTTLKPSSSGRAKTRSGGSKRWRQDDNGPLGSPGRLFSRPEDDETSNQLAPKGDDRPDIPPCHENKAGIGTNPERHSAAGVRR
jgi:hypothetical protein